MAIAAVIFSLKIDGFQCVATILVIDDQVICRQILCQIVSSINGNHDVRDFACPQEALDWTKHHPVALVLVDYKMPEMNGIEFIRMFRAVPTNNLIRCRRSETGPRNVEISKKGESENRA